MDLSAVAEGCGRHAGVARDLGRPAEDRHVTPGDLRGRLVGQLPAKWQAGCDGPKVVKHAHTLSVDEVGIACKAIFWNEYNMLSKNVRNKW